MKLVEKKVVEFIFFVKMHDIVVGRIVIPTEKFEKQIQDDIKTLYNLVKLNTLNLECHKKISEQRYEENRKRWNRYIITIALSEFLFICVSFMLFTVTQDLHSTIKNLATT